MMSFLFSGTTSYLQTPSFKCCGGYWVSLIYPFIHLFNIVVYLLSRAGAPACRVRGVSNSAIW